MGTGVIWNYGNVKILKMDEEALKRICSAFILPLNNQLDNLTAEFKEKLTDLSKAIEFNIQTVIHNVKKEFLSELKKRDDEIKNLKEKVSTLTKKVENTLDTVQKACLPKEARDNSKNTNAYNSQIKRQKNQKRTL